MKKLVSLFLFCLVSLSASAAKEVCEMAPIPDFTLERPYIKLSYSQLHTLTLEKADADAFFEGALRYYYGYSKRLDVPFPKDYKAASLWFYEAGKLDHPLAAFYLGNMYLKGQGLPVDTKSALWWLEKARSLGLIEATQQLSNLYFKSYQNEKLPSTYRDIYLKTTKKYLKDLMDKDYAYAYYDSALVVLKSNDITRFIKADADKLMMTALDRLIKINDKTACYDVLRAMNYYKLPSYKQAQDLFNKKYPR